MYVCSTTSRATLINWCRSPLLLLLCKSRRQQHLLAASGERRAGCLATRVGHFFSPAALANQRVEQESSGANRKCALASAALKAAGERQRAPLCSRSQRRLRSRTHTHTLDARRTRRCGHSARALADHRHNSGGGGDGNSNNNNNCNNNNNIITCIGKSHASRKRKQEVSL